MNLTTSTTEGTPTASSLPFQAQSVIVSNLSASWAYLPDANWPVPPWTYGVTMSVDGASQARISWQTPAGLPAPTVGNGELTAYWTTDSLTPSNGQQVVTPSQQLALPIASVALVSGAGSSAAVGNTFFAVGGGAGAHVRTNYNVPQGTNSLIILWAGTQLSGTGLWTVTVTGNETVTNYGSSFTAPFAIIMGPAGDTSIQVSAIVSSTGSTSPASFTVIASFGTQAVDLSGQPVEVTNPTTPAGVATPLAIEIGGFSAPFYIESSANTSQEVLLPAPGIPGTYNRISQLVVSWTAATSADPTIQVQDSTGTTLWLATVPFGGAAADPCPPPFTFPIPLMTITGTGALQIIVSAAGVAGTISLLSGVYSVY